MWKNIPRRYPFERGANHFDKRGPSGVVNAGNINDDKNKKGPVCNWFKPNGCWGSHNNDSNTNNNRWNFHNLTSSWLGAITWSGALVFGWYTSQLCHLKLKYCTRTQKNEEKYKCNLLSALYPYLSSVNKNPTYIKSVSGLEKIVNNFTPTVKSVSGLEKIGHFTPTVHLISNEQSGNKTRKNSGSSSSSVPDSSDDALSDVLNSIENKLGLAAIENRQFQDGLNLLRSAAKRSYAPALYNLGICYEMGLGVSTNETTAMELYRSAAALEHPGALYNLGIYYGQGRGGLNRDTATATRLLRLAAVQGQQDAIEALKSIGEDSEETTYKEVPIWSQLFKPQIPKPDNNTIPIPLCVENLENIQSNNIQTTVY